MFSKLFGKNAPQINSENPGEHSAMTVAFSNGTDSRSENIDLVRAVEAVLTQNGVKVKRKKEWLIEAATGVTLQPLLVSFNPLEGPEMAAQSCTTIECRHPELFPDGVFEYQHATGDTLEASVLKGFSGWFDLDFPVLMDAFEQKAESCTALEMMFPAEDGAPERPRRALLGPVLHMGVNQGDVDAAEVADSEEAEVHSSFCPCCLFTNSIDAFDNLMKSDGVYGIRMFAMRDDDGGVQADCRVNGEDWDAGEAALIKYAESWPQQGFEFRKQYLVVQSFKRDAEA